MRRLLALVVVVGVCGCAGGELRREIAAPSAGAGFWIVGARVVDGSGAPAMAADVRIDGDRIAEVGRAPVAAGGLDVDARGLVLAPGFIDTHSHADARLLELPDALGALSQGITTAIGGQDGESRLPLAELFAALEGAPAAINFASYAGHGTLRDRVMGDDYRRPASAAEIDEMRRLLAVELEAGALGLSSGLEYDPGIYSTTAEVVALAREAAARGGRYISHVRSEDRRFWEAVDEILEIGRRARIPVQISHLKLAMRSLWGETGRLLATLDAARAAGVEVTADLYPYTYWQSTLTVLFPERDFESLEAATFAVTELASPERMLVPRFEPEPALAGLTLAEIAARRGTEPAATLLELVGEAEALRRDRRAAGHAEGEEGDVESVIAESMREEDVERLMAWPHLNFATDGELDGAHPRGFGTYPRILGRYVRERGALGLEEAIRKMTALAAEHAGIAGRGRIRAGDFADLVLFDPEAVADRATTDDPRALATGVVGVWVNGERVFENGAATGRRPGRVLRRAATAAGPEPEPALEPEPPARKVAPGAPAGPFVRVVGTVQDGGLPHAACACDRCEAARRDPARRRRIASLALVLPESGRVYLIDATPDIREQLDSLADVRHPPAGRVDRAPVDGVFLTHAHIGHYLGLAFFGFEAVHPRGLPVYATASMAAFLRENAPWDGLVERRNVEPVVIAPGVPVELGEGVSVAALAVPHRREYTDTVGYLIAGPRSRVLYVPDTDGWEGWRPPLREVLEGVDLALLDGSFFSLDELPGRDVASIGHPLVRQTMDLLAGLATSGRTRVLFTHLNHSNPALDPGSEARREIERRGFALAAEGEEIPL